MQLYNFEQHLSYIHERRLELISINEMEEISSCSLQK